MLRVRVPGDPTPRDVDLGSMPLNPFSGTRYTPGVGGVLVTGKPARTDRAQMTEYQRRYMARLRAGKAAQA